MAAPNAKPNLADSASAAGSNASLASSSGGEMPAVRRLQELQPRGSMSLERHSYREGDLLGMEAALQADLRRTRSESATVDVMSGDSDGSSSSINASGEEGVDFFEFLNSIQGNQLTNQRSMHTPRVSYSTSRMSSSRLSNDSLSATSAPRSSRSSRSRYSSGKFKSGAILKKLAQQRQSVNLQGEHPPLHEACTFINTSLLGTQAEADRVRVKKGSQPDGGTNRLVVRADGWVTETSQTPSTPASSQQRVQLFRDIDGFEEADPHASFFNMYFKGQDHKNYVGEDEENGAMVVSLRRERFLESNGNAVTTSANLSSSDLLEEARYQYRAIIRSEKRGTTRLVIPESAIPCKGDNPTQRDVLIRIMPECASVDVFRQAKLDAKLAEDLRSVDECLANVARQYKIGVLSCETNQETEAEMYNNATASVAFDEFLDHLGDRVQLEGFQGFRAGLDTKHGQTGTESLHTELESGHEIMFHVSTMLPFNAGDEQQLLRKRHIGNDIVTIVFQAPGARPFDATDFRSNVATVRKADVPDFGPPLPPSATFDIDEIRDGTFRKYLLTKALNGENAGYLADHIMRLGVRTRETLLKNIVSSYASDVVVPGTKLKSSVARKLTIKSKSSRRRSSEPPRPSTDYAFGRLPSDAVKWFVKASSTATSGDEPVPAVLAVSGDSILLVDKATQSAIHYFPSDSVVGWSYKRDGLLLYFGKHQEEVNLYCPPDTVQNIAQQMQIHTNGSLILELELKRTDASQPWGFTVLGPKVQTVAPGGIASKAGLIADHQLFRINGLSVEHMSQHQIVDAMAMFENKVSLLVKVVMGQNSTEPTQPLALSRSPRTLRKSASRDDSMAVASAASTSQHLDDTLTPEEDGGAAGSARAAERGRADSEDADSPLRSQRSRGSSSSSDHSDMLSRQSSEKLGILAMRSYPPIGDGQVVLDETSPSPVSEAAHPLVSHLRTQVSSLEHEVDVLKAHIQHLAQRNAELKAENERLREERSRNSPKVTAAPAQLGVSTPVNLRKSLELLSSTSV